jgi:hypothetical protein
MLIAVVIYVVQGRRHNTSPVVFVEAKRAKGIELRGVNSRVAAIFNVWERFAARKMFF